jgi:carbamoyl-phosphate synthase large subunit
VYKIRNANELRFFARYIPDPIIQEFIPGPEITTDVVCDLNGVVLGIVSRRRIEVRAGEVSKGVTIHDTDIQEACIRIAHALPAVGPITVQCLMSNDKPLFTEINARLGGGIPLAMAAGLNVPALILGRFADIRIDVPALGTYEAGLHITRYDESYFLRSVPGSTSSPTVRQLEKNEKPTFQ